MGWIKKYWIVILAFAFIAMLVFISAGLYIKLAIIKFPLLLYSAYIVAAIAIFLVTFFIFRSARKEDLAQNHFGRKNWFLQNIRQLIVISLVIIFVGVWVFKITETSKSELFNQLSAIMKDSFKPSEAGYYRDVTEIVCPLVSIEKLNEMMRDKYAQKRTKYFESSINSSKPKSDSEWWILEKNALRTLQLKITINKVDKKCEASLRKEAYYI